LLIENPRVYSAKHFFISILICDFQRIAVLWLGQRFLKENWPATALETSKSVRSFDVLVIVVSFLLIKRYRNAAEREEIKSFPPSIKP
jgi:hypothetical protein